MNYLSSQDLFRAFHQVFERVEFREDLFIKNTPGRLNKYLKILKFMPGFDILMREFHARTVFLQKSKDQISFFQNNEQAKAKKST